MRATDAATGPINRGGATLSERRLCRRNRGGASGGCSDTPPRVACMGLIQLFARRTAAQLAGAH
jgi:hypothetical protein